MFEVDRITERGRRAIVDILNKSIDIEYRFLVNYPRLIDQLVNLDRIPDEQLPKDLERLGKDSIQHASWTERLIQLLGGEAQVRISTIDRMVDMPAMFRQLLELEREAQRLFQQARRVAEQSKVRGIREKVKEWLRLEPSGVAARSDIIRMLDRMASDEQVHIDLAEKLISALGR